MAASSDNIMQRRKIPIRTSGSTAFQQGEGEGATGSTSQHRAPPVVVGMAHTVAEDPRDRPCFGLGQLTHEIDGFQRTNGHQSSATSTTRRALPYAPESSGYVDTLAWRACSRAAPSCSAHLRRGCSISANWRYQRGVHRKLGSPKQGKSINHHLKADDCPSWPLADRGCGRRHSWKRDHQLHTTNLSGQRTPRTNPDWPRLLLWSKLRGGGTSSGQPHRQLREAAGKGSQRRTEEEDVKHLRSENKKRLDDGMHENGKPAIGQDCERISACSVGERHGHTTTSLKTNLHRLSGKELPPMTWSARVTLVLMGRALSGQQRRPVRTLKTSISEQITAVGQHQQDEWLKLVGQTEQQPWCLPH